MPPLQPKIVQGKVAGKIGFDEEKPKEDGIMTITKEETMFKVDKDGKAIPEKCPILIYDRSLDRELIDETFLLMQAIKKQKAIKRIIADTLAKQTTEITTLQAEIDKETDEKKKKKLQAELSAKKTTESMECIKSDINTEIVNEGITESREIIRELKKEIEKQKTKKMIELAPCTTAEAYQSFENGKTIDGKDIDDWVADLISKKVGNPKYTFEEAKRLKPNYKIAIKEAIMEVSDYKTKDYRDIMMEIKLQEEKPLTAKKD